MKTKADIIQTKIYQKMSATKKIKILDDFIKFARKVKQNDSPKILTKNKLGS